MAGPGRPSNSELAELEQAKYDATGFLITAQPHLSEQQVSWLVARMGVLTDDEACEQTDIDPSIIEQWLEDPEFDDIRQKCMSNKREAFRYLGTQLLPKVLRVCIELLNSTGVKAQRDGAMLLLRTQGLLIDKVQTKPIDAMDRLVEKLRQTVVIDTTYEQVHESTSRAGILGDARDDER